MSGHAAQAVLPGRPDKGSIQLAARRCFMSCGGSMHAGMPLDSRIILPEHSGQVQMSLSYNVIIRSAIFIPW